MATKHTTSKPNAKRTTAIAALSLEIVDRTGKTIQLTPAGSFTSIDGRPGSIADCAAWVMDAENAQTIIDAYAARRNDVVIDYEHQTLLKEQNGQPAPAAGWFKTVEWREGEGLFATDVDWTPKAAQAIADEEYRFISPVIQFDKQTGRVTAVLMAALTNYPGIDGMAPATLAALNTDFFNALDEEVELPNPNIHKEPIMNKLLAALFATLGLDAKATEEQAMTALTAFVTKATTNESAVATLSAQVTTNTTPDPAKYVPIEAVKDLQGQVADLSAKMNGGDVDKVIQTALSAGKLLPSLEKWARELGNKDLAALTSFIDANPAIPSLNKMQTGGKAPDEAVTALTAQESEICKNLGVAESDFIAHKAKLAQQASAQS
jgi:phage I-like protein